MATIFYDPSNPNYVSIVDTNTFIYLSSPEERYQFRGNPRDPISPDLDFLEQLALVVFGSKQFTLFNSPGSIIFEYRNTINRAVHTVNSSPQDIGNSAAEVVFNQMLYFQEDRFDLISISSINTVSYTHLRAHAT